MGQGHQVRKYQGGIIRGPVSDTSARPGGDHHIDRAFERLDFRGGSFSTDPAAVVCGPDVRFGPKAIAKSSHLRCDVAIADLERAGLPAPSVVRPAKLACIEPGRVDRRVGRLDKAAARMVGQRLRGFLG